MSLAAGTRFGPYEVVAPLGAGGMGEVYRARDTRLDRTVALKVLPAGVSADSDRHERFRREARAISRLSHPHICTLHDVGEQDGVDFLVMEYLAGETLAHRLLRGALPLDEVLRIGIELAGGLDAAHREGVTHRDLKPANVMLTPGGAKILDFGLAKWTQALTAVQGEPHAATDPSLTQSGIVVGTVPYMAPEQAEGKPADARSDLFALGAMLYEMTTGRRAFEGTSPSRILAAILTSSPPSMTELQPLTPPAFDRTVKKCLAKDPAKRWQTAADLRDELAWIMGDRVESGSPSASATTAATGRWRKTAWYALAAAAILALVTALVAMPYLRDMPAESRVTRLVIAPPEGTVYPAWNLIESAPVVSPDGRYIAFVAHRSGELNAVWLRPLDSLAAYALPGTENASSHSAPFWSPDSRSLGFFAEGKLKRIEIAGGPPQVLADAPDARGGAWNKEDIILFAPDPGGPIYRIPASGGAATAVSKLQPSESGHRWPVFLPDGRHFIFHSRSAPEYEKSGTDVGSLDSPDVKRLLPSTTTFVNVAYSRTGHLLFERRGALLAQPFDAERLLLTGSPQTVVDHLASDAGPGAAFSISSDGVLVYRQAPKPVSSQLKWFDRGGRQQGTLGEPADQHEPAVAPDGKRVAVTRGPEVWLLSTETGAASRFTFEGVFDLGDSSPTWSPDGRWIAFGVQQPGFVGLLRRAANGMGEPERLATTRYTTFPTDWSRDGRYIIYGDQDPVTGVDLWALPLQGESKPLPLVQTRGWDEFGQLSPDGRWLAYSSNVSGRSEVYVQAFPAAHGKWQVSAEGGTQPRWRGDGRELFYIARDKQLTAVEIKQNAATLDIGAEQLLFEVHVRTTELSSYTVTPDGQRFLVNTVLSDTSQPIVVVQNWGAARKK